jgi:hypothetical protein
MQIRSVLPEVFGGCCAGRVWRLPNLGYKAIDGDTVAFKEIEIC